MTWALVQRIAGDRHPAPEPEAGSDDHRASLAELPALHR